MKGRIVDGAALVLAEGDTVATALEDLPAGRSFDELGVTLPDDVPFGHKFALEAHGTGTEIRKYGEVIGRASAAIEAGEWVHTHNCESTRGRGDLAAEGGSP